MNNPTVLVLRALGLGDFVTGLPALRLLRDLLPGCRIVLAAPPEYAPLARAAGTVDAVVAARELVPIRDAPWRPELALDLHGNGPASRRLLEPCRPRRIVAYAGGPVRWRADEHEIERWCRLVRAALDAPHAPTPPLAGLLPVPDVPAPAGRTLVHCGAKAPARRWQPDRFAELARRLHAAGHRVVVTGGPAEAGLAREIAAAAGVPAELPAGLPALLALTARARLVVSGDTGVAHLASVYGVCSVTLCGPVSPAVWGPPPRARHQVVWHGDGTGDPHGTVIDPALARITVEQVLTAAAAALAGAGADDPDIPEPDIPEEARHG